MNFGALTEKAKLILEERTALLINLAGTTAQETLSIVDDGILARKFYKILANVIIDWHWLPYKVEKFQLNGIGYLVWIPNRFGGLGQINPAIEYEQIELHFGVFANMAELFSLKPYNTYGYRDTVVRHGQRYFLFPTFIGLDVLNNSGVEGQEIFYWKELVKIYSKMDDQTLDALASSRNRTLTVHSLWTLFVLWERHMGKAINALRRRHPASLDELKKKELLINIENARNCIREIYSIIKYHRNIEDHLEKGREYAINSELFPLIPCVDELNSEIPNKLDIFIVLADVLESLHDVCREFQIQLDLGEPQEVRSRSTLEKKLRHLAENLELESDDLVNPEHWHLLFLQDGARKETARLVLKLIKTTFNVFEKKLHLSLGRITGHYEGFLINNYPLPNDHFIPGN